MRFHDEIRSVFIPGQPVGSVIIFQNHLQVPTGRCFTIGNESKLNWQRLLIFVFGITFVNRRPHPNCPFACSPQSSVPNLRLFRFQIQQ